MQLRVVVSLVKARRQHRLCFIGSEDKEEGICCASNYVTGATLLPGNSYYHDYYYGGP